MSSNEAKKLKWKELLLNEVDLSTFLVIILFCIVIKVTLDKDNRCTFITASRS